MSGTVCCYKGCVKSYSTDKDVSFFKFPDDQKRRKKWMDNCGMPELHTLNERQLRLKRVCADHFAAMSFICTVTRNQLTEKAVPLSQKEHEAAVKAAVEAHKDQVLNPKRGRGRPPKSFSLVLVKKEPAAEAEDKEEEEQEVAREEEDQEEEEEEEDEIESEEGEEDEPNENGDSEYSPPPNLRKQILGPKPKKVKAPKKPPKLVAVKSKKIKDEKPNYVSSLLPAPSKSKSRTDSDRKSGGRRMADLSVIEDVVREMSAGVVDRSKKRHSLNSDERILAKRMKSAGFNDEDANANSEDDMTDMDDSDEEEEGLLRANREFEMFQSGLRKIIKLPPTWGMGSVVWDPLNKMKVIPIFAPKLLPNGTICLFKAIQVYENSTVKVAIDEVDMTLNFGIEKIEVQEDVNKIIKAVADCRVCTGVENFLPDDIIYLPDARKRGYKYYSDACPVILADSSVESNVCNPCIALQKAVLVRKENERKEIATRKLRAVPKNLKNDFGRSLYGLLGEILDDSNALKSDNKEEREAVLSKYSTELGVMNGEIQKPEKIPHVQVSVDEVSASFQDIVTRLGFSLNKKPGPGGLPTPPQPQPPKPLLVPKVEDNRSQMFANKPFLNRYNKPVKTTNFNQQRVPISSSSTSISISGGSSTSFCLGDGQTYEILGEVGSSEMVQGTKGEAIEIIEVDDETMAKLTAQNPGMMFHNSAPGSLQVATLDPLDPNISQILKAINPSQA